MTDTKTKRISEKHSNGPAPATDNWVTLKIPEYTMMALRDFLKIYDPETINHDIRLIMRLIMTSPVLSDIPLQDRANIAFTCDKIAELITQLQPHIPLNQPN